MKNNCTLICPQKRYSTYILYLKYVFPYRNIKINKFENNFSDNVIIDPESLSFFDNLEIDKNLKIIIMLWNGYYDYIKFSDQIKKIKKKFHNNSLDNLKFFIVGNFCPLKKNFLIIDHFKLKKKKLNFLNEPLTYKLNRNLKIIKRFYLFLKSPFLHIKYLVKSKFFFIGYSSIDIPKLKNFSNYKSGMLKDNCFYFFKKFLAITDQLDSGLILKEFKLMLDSDEFKNLPIHNKYYTTHLIFRHFFVRKMKKFKNFIFNENDNAIQFYNHNFTKKSFFIDLGSKLGNDKSSRSLIHLDLFPSQYFDLCIKNCDRKNFSKKFYKYVELLFYFIDNNKKINPQILKDLENLILKDQ